MKKHKNKTQNQKPQNTSKRSVWLKNNAETKQYESKKIGMLQSL